MKTKVLFLALIVSFFGCKKDKSKPGNNNEQVTISSDATALNARVTNSDAGVVIVDPSAGGMQKMTADSSSNQYPMELIATVAPPVIEGDTLRATHVDINGSYAYVSYNTEGVKYKGGIDVFNISAPAKPVLVSTVIFPNTDISAIAYYNNRLYIAGARNADMPAIVGYIELTSGVPSNTFVSRGYAGFVATGLALADGKLYLTTGSTGGLYVLNAANLELQHSIVLPDARCVATNAAYIAVQTGSAGINIYNKSSYALIRNITIGTDIAESKRTMDFNNDYLFVAAGKGGNRYYDVTTGALLSQIALPTSITGVADPNDIVTNAVSYNNKLFFSANGAAGAYISTENSSTHTLNRLGSFGFGLGNSINYVKSKDNFVFVAAGRGGMKIIRFTPAGASCTGLSNYTGSTNLNINSNKDFQYAGSLMLNSLNINSNSSLFYCGSLAIADNSNINSNGRLEIQGTMSFGSPGKTLTVNSNATLRINGNVTIYGNLNLNSNAKLEFVGTGNSITIHGTVTKGSGVSISGTYTDVNGKL